jgi:hypothetical protein
MAKSYNGSSQINTFIKGMNMDMDFSNITKDAYIYGQNVRVVLDEDNTTGVLQALEGIRELNPMLETIPPEETVIGVAVVRDVAAIFTEFGDGMNSIYRFRYRDDVGTYELKKLTTQQFRIGGDKANFRNMSIATKWEDADNIKVYWADGYNELRAINIYDGSDGVNLGAGIDYFGSIPKVVFNQPSFLSFEGGSLKCGMYQYAYQLFSVNGGQTATSPLSDMIHVTSSNTRDAAYEGNSSSDISNKSIRMQIQLDDTSFNQIRIYALRYTALHATPEVRIVLESPTTGSVFTFVDNGNMLTESTWEEFAVSSPYAFVPRVIEAKDDRLFAANIVEDTWVIPGETSIDYFDTRVFGFNALGEALVYNESDDISNPDAAKRFTMDQLSSMPDEEWKKFLPIDHDCINPVNYYINKRQADIPLRQTCFYGLDGARGAVGRNISLKVIHTMLGEGAQQTVSNTWADKKMGYITNPDSKLLNTWDSDGAYNEFTELPYWYNLPDTVDSRISDGKFAYKAIGSTDRCINYANEKIDAKAKGYQRDALYRLGVVFYNDRGQTTPVNWMCDLRMPTMTSKQHRLFDQNKRIQVGVGDGKPVFVDFEIATYPVGLELSFFNGLPEGTVAVEIVRCERSHSDRNILAQGIISNTASWKDLNARSLVYMGLGRSFKMALGTGSVIGNDFSVDHVTYLDDYLNSASKKLQSQPLLFASPELSVSQDKFTDEVSDSSLSLHTLYGLIAPHKVQWFDEKTYTPGVGQAYMPGVIDYPYAYDATMHRRGGNQLIWTKTLPHHQGGFGKTSGDNNEVIVSKYYNPFNSGSSSSLSGNTASLNHVYRLAQFKVNKNIDSYGREDAENGMYNEAINGWTYVNWCIEENNLREAGFGEYDRDVKEGPHGVSAVFSFPGTQDKDVLFDEGFWLAKVGGSNTNYFGQSNIVYDMYPNDESSFFAQTYTLLTNLLQNVTPYGGLSYRARTQSNYVTTTAYKHKDQNIDKFVVFGGDTYIGIHDYCVTYPFYTETDNKLFSKTSVFAYFPCESSINLSLMHGSNFHNYANAGLTYPTDLSLQPTSVPLTGFTQDEAMYGYNTAYSSNSIGREFVPQGIYSQNDKGFDYRIFYSEAKELDEISDNWLNFKPANYKDVDTRYGSINRMMLFKNELFFWQDDAFGVLSVNPRSLITDGNAGALLLGTGDTVERYDYITVHNGSKKNMMNNIVQTPSSLFWYDADRAEILSFDQGLNTISKVKGVQSHLNRYRDKVDSHMITLYDKKYNDVYFKFNYKDSVIDNNLLYNEQINAFSSFVTGDPDWFMDFKHDFISIKDKQFFVHNAGPANTFYNGTDRSLVKYVVNDNYPLTKIYDNVTFDGLLEREHVSDVIFGFTTKTQESLKVKLPDIDRREDTYRFAIPRENYEGKGRMRGKYLTTTLDVLPTDVNFKLSYIQTIYRISNI